MPVNTVFAGHFFYFYISKNAEILKNKKRKSWQSTNSNKTATIMLIKYCISTS